MPERDVRDLHVIFGAGPVGLAVVDALLARQPGASIRIVNRRGVPGLPPGVESRAGDVQTPGFARAAAEGASHIYFALNPPYEQWPALFPGLQQAVLEAAMATRARLIVMDNLYMYGNTQGKPLTEDLPHAAKTVKGRLRASMAESLMAAHRRGDVQVAVARASDFIGPRVVDSAMGERVIGHLLQGKAAQVMGNPDLPHTYTFVPDVATALVTLGQRDEALGQVWHVPAAETLTTRQLVTRLAAEAGVEARIMAAPKWLLRLLGLFDPTMRAVSEMSYQFEVPFVVDHSKYVRTFGNPATPLPQVVHETVTWFRAYAGQATAMQPQRA